ncbi:zeatin O-glucosyltransferase [Lactuca sativa]|uniref:zeatin O-glucosyltransferase n=1 Tax=Lactuca sativa TaxID=4236 RepID=UPI000CC6B8AD|nr:zeatin O-glucosyltransferase [Lactuca sativa]
MEGDERNATIHSPSPVAEVVVVMVPFLAQGHLNQLLHLSRLISTYKIPVHFVTTTTHIRQVRSRFHDFSSHSAASNLIHFHALPTPPFTSPHPNPSSRFPSHLQPAFESSLHLRRPVADLILSLSSSTTRVAVIHDFMMSYVVQDVKAIPNAETYIFRPLSAFHTFWLTWERLSRPFPVDPGMLKRLPSADGSLSPEFKEFVKQQLPHVGYHVGELFDSSRVIEGEYLEYLEREELNDYKKLWAIGPSNHVDRTSFTVSKNHHKCLQWLDLQPPTSVVYVSFGTTTTFSDEQITELAIGLERSQQRFIWVVRSADKGDVFGDEAKMADLPEGFEERVEGRGLVVRGWAPQTGILGHVATGGFMTHCGWNSCTESISNGVPTATWPMHSDQPRNAFLMTDVLRIGLVVQNWEHRDELVTSVVVENVIRRLMDSKEGEEVRERAVELADTVKKSVVEGGESSKETDSFISYISRHG